MNNILLNTDIQSRILHIIDDATKVCYIVTPWFNPWDSLLKSLEKAIKLKKKIIFILRKEEKSSLNDAAEHLAHYGFDIYLVKGLHTKLYLNENEAVIASFNINDYSKEFNYELGYDVTDKEELQYLKEKVIKEDLLSGPDCTKYFYKYKQNMIFANGRLKGHCIRCKASIPFDPYKPLCKDCYRAWSVDGFLDEPENYCHRCGKDMRSGIVRSKLEQPFCEHCYEMM